MSSLRSRTVLGAGLGLLLVLALALVGPAFADDHEGKAKKEKQGDTRPTEIPYDTPGDIPLLSPDYRQTSHKVVLITDQALNPSSVRVKEGQLVAWLSYASNPTVIVFEREVAKSMVCHSLVNFQLTEDELRSGPIHTGEFASFCELTPGRYEYILKRPAGSMVAPYNQGRNRIRGEIIVGDG